MTIDERLHNSPSAGRREKLTRRRKNQGKRKRTDEGDAQLTRRRKNQGKRKRTDEGDDGAAASKKIPWDLHILIQDALELRELMEDSDDEYRLELFEDRLRSLAEELKKLKQLPRDWKYDPATASTYVGAEMDESPRPKMILPREKRLGCCSSAIDPNQKFPKTRDVPLNEEEKKIWMDFKEFDKDNPGLDRVSMNTVSKHRRPLLVDNPIVSLTGNFAVTAFNEAIEMYVKKGEKNNIHDFDIVYCKYLKINETSYYFYISIEAFEERRRGVYDAKVTLNWDDGSKSLLHFVLTDCEPDDDKKTTKRKTLPGSWQDGSGIKYSGMRPRLNRRICRGYDYLTPWGDGGP